MNYLLSRPLISRVLIFLGIAIVAYFFVNFALALPLKILIGGLGFLAVSLVIFFKIEWGVYILVFSMAQSFEIPLGSSGGQALSIFTDEMVLLAVILAWVVRQITLERGNWTATKLSKPILTLMFIALASLVYSGFYITQSEFLVSLFHLLKWVEYFLVFFIVTNTIKTKKQVSGIVKLMIIVGLAVSVFGIYENITGNHLFTEHVYIHTTTGSVRRVVGTFETSHELGAFLLFPIVLLVSLGLEAKKMTHKIFYFALAGIPLYPFGFSFSRGSYTALFSAIAALAYIKKNKPMIIALILAVIFANRLLPRQVLDRVVNTLAEGQDISVTDRIDIWRRTLAFYLYHPLIGIGFWNSYLLKYIGVGPHNSFLQFLLEMGIAGFASFVWLIIALLKAIIEALRSSKDSLSRVISSTAFSILIGFLFFSLTAEVFFWARIMGFFWLLMGLVFVSRKIESHSKPIAQGND